MLKMIISSRNQVLSLIRYLTHPNQEQWPARQCWLHSRWCPLSFKCQEIIKISKICLLKVWNLDNKWWWIIRSTLSPLLKVDHTTDLEITLLIWEGWVVSTQSPWWIHLCYFSNSSFSCLSIMHPTTLLNSSIITNNRLKNLLIQKNRCEKRINYCFSAIKD